MSDHLSYQIPSTAYNTGSNYSFREQYETGTKMTETAVVDLTQDSTTIGIAISK
jgi:hypothetical protein